MFMNPSDSPPPSWYDPPEAPVCPTCGEEFDGLQCECGYEPPTAEDIRYERARQRSDNPELWD